MYQKILSIVLPYQHIYIYFCIQFYFSVGPGLVHPAESEAAAGAAVQEGGCPAAAAGKGGLVVTGKRGKGPGPDLVLDPGPRIDPEAAGIQSAGEVDLEVGEETADQEVGAPREPLDHVLVPQTTGKPDMMMNHPVNKWKTVVENILSIENNKGHIVGISEIYYVGTVHKYVWKMKLYFRSK